LNYLIGTYECKIDVKGRVLIPSSLKKQLSSVLSKGFVLKRAVFQNCLELYPINEWEELIKRVNSLNRFKKKNNDFIRRFTAGVKFIEVDNNNRILIPKDLIEFSNIKRDIVFSSSVNIIEIWDKEKYENAIVDSREDFAKLAEEVMGDDNE
jgi:MraZ protein